jgi:hypothetical protein
VKTGVPPMISGEVVINVLLMRDRLSAKPLAGKRRGEKSTPPFVHFKSIKVLPRFCRIRTPNA